MSVFSADNGEFSLVRMKLDGKETLQTVFMVTPRIINHKYFYYPTNALNYMNCRTVKNTLKV